MNNNILLENKFYTKEIEKILQALIDDLETEERRGKVRQLWETMKIKYYTPNENNSNVSSQAGQTGISRAANDNRACETTRVHRTNANARNRSRELSSAAI